MIDSHFLFRQEYGKELKDMVYVSMSDNAGSAANVARELDLCTCRCYAHILALAPVHLNFPVRRQSDGVARLQPHEHAIPQVFNVLEKARSLCKLLLRKYGRDAAARELECVQRRLNQKVLLPKLDNSSEWSSTFAMVDRFVQLQPALVELAATQAHLFPRQSFFTGNEYESLREIAGCLRPFMLATNTVQTAALSGSVVLPLVDTLAHQLQPEIPVRVSAGDVDHKLMMEVQASFCFV